MKKWLVLLKMMRVRMKKVSVTQKRRKGQYILMMNRCLPMQMKMSAKKPRLRKIQVRLTTNLTRKKRSKKMKLTLRLRLMVRRTAQAKALVKKKIRASKITLTRLSWKMTKLKPMKQTKTKMIRLISKGNKNRKSKNQRTSKTKIWVNHNKLINRAKIYFSSLLSNFKRRSNRSKSLVKSQNQDQKPKSKLKRQLWWSLKKIFLLLLMVTMIWLMNTCLMIRLSKWKENWQQIKLRIRPQTKKLKMKAETLKWRKTKSSNLLLKLK
jgi:hypothetical protein